jgi:tetratricopeptide (TPR) repeat protein
LKVLGLIINIGISLWVLYDAKQIGVRKGLIKGLGNMGPWGWYIACLLLWIVVLPFYLYKRNEFIKINLLTPKDIEAIEANDQKTESLSVTQKRRVITTEQKNIYKNAIKKRRIAAAALFLLLIITWLPVIFSNFLSNRSYGSAFGFLFLFSTIALTFLFYRYFPQKPVNQELPATGNPSHQIKWIRLLGFGIFSIILSIPLVSATLPWLYTGIAGSKGDILAKVTDLGSYDRNYSYPKVDNQITPLKVLCVSRADRDKYSKGTTLRLKGKVSALGINISHMEIETERLIKEGLADSQAGKYQTAIEKFNQAILSKTDSAEAYMERGGIYFKLGQNENALADMNKVLSMKWKYAEAYYSRGLVYAAQNQLQPAIDDFNKAISLKPAYYLAHIHRGTAYAKLGQYQQASEDYSKTVMMEPGYAEAYYMRARNYSRLGQYQQAVEDYNKAISLQPADMGFHSHLAEILMITGSPDKAEAEADIILKAAQSAPDKAIGNYLKAVSCRLQGKNTAGTDRELQQLCAQEFQFAWTFEGIENWLKVSKISKAQKKYISENISLLKKHALPES